MTSTSGLFGGILKVAILRNENHDSGDNWLQACQKRGIVADIIDLCSINAIEQIKKGEYSFCVLRPPGSHEVYKSMYDEKLFHIVHTLKIPCFPSFFECFIYENKKSLATFLDLAGIKHPKTSVIGYYDEARRFISSCSYPIVAKTSIGAAGSGVSIINNKSMAKKYIRLAFKGNGIRKRVGPNRQTGSPKSWFQKAISDPKFFKRKVKQYLKVYNITQRDFVIFQEYVAHDYEWRIVKIGKSYFAYKKFKVVDKASGGGNLGYDNPPLQLMTWIHDIAMEHNIATAAFDVLVSKDGYYMNEIQTIFGQSREHILEIEGKPGRYLYQDGDWVFEEGLFNTNQSYDLRLEAALDLFAKL